MREQQNIEWKRLWRDEYLEWVCGFANGQGGKLYIGIDDQGKVFGLKNGKKLLEDLPNKFRDTLGIVVEVNHHEKCGKDYIEIVVPPYPAAISCKGVFYLRVGATNQRLTGAALEAFLMRKRGVNWENMPILQLELDDLSDDAIKKYVALAVNKGRIATAVTTDNKETFIERLHLKDGSWLTNAAALLFSPDPEKWIAGAYVKIGFFENDADLIYQDEVRGPIFEQVDRVIDLVFFKYLKAKISYDNIQRVERYPYPIKALREAVLNAIVHKDYSSGIPIQISVYADKLYIANCGQLPETWTIENLMGKHVSRPYNPNIANAFYLLGYIESWGRGVEQIFSACRDDGIQPPEYVVHPGDIMLMFAAPVDRVVQARGGANDRAESGERVNDRADKADEKVNDRADSGEKVNDQADKADEKVNDSGEKVNDRADSGEKVNDQADEADEKVNDRANKHRALENNVLRLIEQNPNITVSALSERLGVSRKTVSSKLKSLKEAGRIERVGSNRKGYWQPR